VRGEAPVGKVHSNRLQAISEEQADDNSLRSVAEFRSTRLTDSFTPAYCASFAHNHNRLWFVADVSSARARLCASGRTKNPGLCRVWQRSPASLAVEDLAESETLDS
jgi:hypothetical protein